MILIIIVIVMIVLLTPKDEPKLTYDAHFGDDSEVLSMWNDGFAIIGNKGLKLSQCFEHCLLTAPSGGGKSSVVMFSSIAFLARSKCSMIINDTTGELWATSSYLEKKGYTVLRFDPTDASRTLQFNPLLNCKGTAGANKLALVIVRNAIEQSKSEPFWENSCIMLISMMIRFLIGYTDPEYRTLQNVLRLIEKFTIDGKAVDRLFVKAKVDSALMDTYMATLKLGQKTIESVVATARTSLQLFTDQEVCKSTVGNFNFDLLREKPIALFVSTPLQDLKYYKPLTSLLFQSLFDHILSRIPKKQARPVMFLMDEFASMRFPDIVLTISTIRKFKAGLLICVTDEMSLTDQYGQAQAHQIVSNCATKVYLKTPSPSAAKHVSLALGRYSLVNDHGKESGSRELMTCDEVARCEDALFLLMENGHIDVGQCRTIKIGGFVILRKVNP